jgi:uncharacterized SAM-binding protein YcdF (DUF218 family)
MGKPLIKRKVPMYHAQTDDHQILSDDVVHAAQVLWDFHAVGHALKPCDVMLVLGGYDLSVPRYAAQLYHQGLAPRIICTGGIAHTDDLLATGWDKTEADMFADVMRDAGVPQDAIILEPTAQNTGENYSASRVLLEEMEFPFQSVLVVTQPCKERRALATGEARWPDKDLLVTAPRAQMLDYWAQSDKGIANEIAIMVGDLQRFRVYPARGFMSLHIVPDPVWKAFEFLVFRGFSGHLVG